ncbi:pantetheine-phosphate adenylyltransferase [Heliophilum fasciatum]|uniref:Phosphopantetheine adenylyltransferase n=1 Tax=Heliophilum fasciatum TaxID=35700 RepID=A0A4R2RL83_9FIRM|nr:pantetheine-phosphate adenylyltransferase [Heliophilum fasciatum]MCW2278407.1 pantetheine-phosphate adenylyltransferase [Heliophilum fasciatum]TCP63694.1 phosphopantetheine adenylyltransferase [Heliophilum fasciatum]
MAIAIYPGSFDPITNGHIDVIQRAANIFSQVIVAIVKNPSKTPLFSMDERMEMIDDVCALWPNVQVQCFSGLLVDFVRAQKASAIIRGLRAVSDFENEFQMSMMNKRLYSEADTVFLAAQSDYAFLSSSMVKEVASLGGDVRDYLPPVVYERLQKKLMLRSTGR